MRATPPPGYSAWPHPPIPGGPWGAYRPKPEQERIGIYESYGLAIMACWRDRLGTKVRP